MINIDSSIELSINEDIDMYKAEYKGLSWRQVKCGAIVVLAYLALIILTIFIFHVPVTLSFFLDLMMCSPLAILLFVRPEGMSLSTFFSKKWSYAYHGGYYYKSDTFKRYEMLLEGVYDIKVHSGDKRKIIKNRHSSNEKHQSHVLDEQYRNNLLAEKLEDSKHLLELVVNYEDNDIEMQGYIKDEKINNAININETNFYEEQEEVTSNTDGSNNADMSTKDEKIFAERYENKKMDIDYAGFSKLLGRDKIADDDKNTPVIEDPPKKEQEQEIEHIQIAEKIEKDYEDTGLLYCPPSFALLNVKTNKLITLTVGENKIGRSPSFADILIKTNKTISGKHAIITIYENTVLVKDLNSRNGTFVNGKKIESDMHIEIKEGCNITLSDEEYRLVRGNYGN